MHHYSGDDVDDAGDAHDIDIDSDDRFRSVAGIGTSSTGRTAAPAAAAPHPYHYVSDAALRTVVADRDHQPAAGAKRGAGGGAIGTPKKGPAEITDTGNLDDITAHRMPGEWTTEVPQSSPTHYRCGCLCTECAHLSFCPERCTHHCSHTARWCDSLTWYDVRVVVWSLIAVVTNVGMVVSLVKVGLRLPTLQYWTLNFGCLLFNVPFFLYAYIYHYFYRTLTPDMRRPKWKVHLFIMGLFVAFNGLFVVFANPHVGGALQTMLLQANIPATMALSVVFLRSRYAWSQYLGATVVMAGVICSLGPEFRASSDAQGMLSGSFGWSLIFLLASIPAALNTIYQEYAFREQSMDIGYLMAWSNLGQWISLILMAPFDAIKGFGTVGSVNEIWAQYRAGLQCFFNGTNNLGENTTECQDMWQLFMLFVMFYVTANFANAANVKYGNATFSILISIASTVLADFAFSQTWLMYDDAKPLTPYNYAALVIIIAGTLMFRWSAVAPPDERNAANAVTPANPNDTGIEVSLNHDENDSPAATANNLKRSSGGRGNGASVKLTRTEEAAAAAIAAMRRAPASATTSTTQHDPLRERLASGIDDDDDDDGGAVGRGGRSPSDSRGGMRYNHDTMNDDDMDVPDPMPGGATADSVYHHLPGRVQRDTLP